MADTRPLYRAHELAFRTQYAEVRERATAAGALLRGTPGTLHKRTGTGHEYWYRVYYSTPGRQAEEFVGPLEDERAYHTMSSRIEEAKWTGEQVRNLRKLGFQVADKVAASVLVELHNLRLFDAGLVVVGTLAYMSWLNEHGVMAVAARTQDLDLARRQPLKLAAPVSFLDSLGATQLSFAPVPGMPSHKPSTAVKLRGREGFRVDMLTSGDRLGETVELPELQWHATAIPYYDYLLEGSEPAAILAGNCCIPVRLPRADRMIWHKLYASVHGDRIPAKAQKDLVQAATLAAVLVEQDDFSIKQSLATAPGAVRAAALKRLPGLQSMLTAHPRALAELGA